MPMRHPFCLRHTRQIASATLFVWLFALLASWANACMLQASASANAREHHERSRLEASHGVIHEVASVAGGAHGPRPVQEACASFCETQPSIVTKAQPAKGDGAASPAALLAQVGAGWPAFTPAGAYIRGHPLAAPPPRGPPVAIAFLRLTL